MSFTQAIRTCFSKFATFDGRACRSEYWYFALFGQLLNIVVQVLIAMSESFLILLLFSLILLIPVCAVGVRRCHDLDKSGWMFLVGLIPIVNLYLMYLFCLKGTDGTNRYGEDPFATAGRHVDNSFTQEKINSSKENDNLAFWVFVYTVVKTGRLSKENQQLIAEKFGTEKRDKLADMLKDLNIREAQKNVELKIINSAKKIHNLSPKTAEKQINMVISRIEEEFNNPGLLAEIQKII